MSMTRGRVRLHTRDAGGRLFPWNAACTWVSAFHLPGRLAGMSGAPMGTGTTNPNEWEITA